MPVRAAEPDDQFYDEPADYPRERDEDDEYDDDDDEYGYATSRGGRGGRGTSRSPGGPPLGSYESRRAALNPPRRRGPAWLVLPVLALGAIGFGAVRLLSPHPAGHLVIQGDQRAPSPTASSSRPSGPLAAGTTAFTSFPGYPGQQGRNGGAVAVNAVGTANGRQLAVGSADGYPAVWQRGPGASWSLAGGTGIRTGRPGNQTLIAVTAGPAGWLAVGGVVSGATQHPVVVTSPDGQAWQAVDGSAAFGAPGHYAYGAAAGRVDYVIVGEQVTGHTTTAATWWSAGLGGWSQGSAGSGNGKQSEMFAVTVGPERFIAAGADGSQPAVWTSLNGQHWTVTDLALPAGTTRAALREVTHAGARVIATGNAETPNGTVAFAEVSGDDGGTWREVALPAPGRQATVTALAASGNGFAAAGQAGQDSPSSAVAWTSCDGKNWAPARVVPSPGGGTVKLVTALAAANGTVTGIGLATTKAGVSPVVYTAPSP
jgi:hypothetical protein